MAEPFKLNADKRSATINIAETCTADELQKMITELAELRAQMEPPVPFDQPEPSDDTDVLLQDRPYFGVGLHRSGRLYVWLRSAGLGWMVFRIPADQVPSIRDYLIANTTTEPKDPAFFSQKGGDPNEPH